MRQAIRPAIRDTIDTALDLTPDTREIRAISDATVSGISARRELESVLRVYAGRVKTGGRSGLRIRAGEDPGAIPIENTGTAIAMFDYKQMERFNIPVSKLPAGSIIINKPASVSTIHREFAITITAILIALAIAVFWMKASI